MAQCLLDGTASLARTGVDTGGITPVMSCSELETAQLLDVRYPTCSGTEAVVGINPCANVAVGDGTSTGASGRVSTCALSCRETKYDRSVWFQIGSNLRRFIGPQAMFSVVCTVVSSCGFMFVTVLASFRVLALIQRVQGSSP